MVETKKNRIIINLIGVILLISPLLLIKREIDNDSWFILNCGRFVIENGYIPTIEPFTIHEGFNFIMQQWLADIIYWLLYSTFGQWAMIAFVYCMYGIFAFITYKLCMYVSEKNRIVSYLVTFLASACIATSYMVSRPQAITGVIMVLEIYLLEHFAREQKWKYLIGIVFLSVIQINIHAAYWPFLFISMLPYILDSFKIKINGIGSNGYKKLPLFITIFLMLLAGLVNPYGYHTMTYFTKSTGNSNVSNLINEMDSVNLLNGVNAMEIAVVIITLTTMGVLIWKCHKPETFKLRYYLLTYGYAVASIMALKSFMLFIAGAIFILAYCFKDFEIQFSEKVNKKKVAILSILLVVVLGLSPFILSLSQEDEEGNCKEAVKYIVDNYDNENVSLYICYDDGGYSEFYGLRSYIDPRAEVFLKKVNLKEDVFEEYADLQHGKIDYKKFLNKYNFTHILVRNDDYLYNKLKNDNDYKIVYHDDYNDLYVPINNK